MIGDEEPFDVLGSFGLPVASTRSVSGRKPAVWLGWTLLPHSLQRSISRKNLDSSLRLLR